MKRLAKFAVVGLILGAAQSASAQFYSAYSPIVGYTPAVTNYGYGPAYSPVTTYYAPTAAAATSYYAPTTTYYAPAAAPAVAYYAPATPVTSYYAAPVTSYYAPAVVPTTTYYAPAAVPVTAYYGPTTYVRSKVYVTGEPVRNFLRAVTP